MHSILRAQRESADPVLLCTVLQSLLARPSSSGSAWLQAPAEEHPWTDVRSTPSEWLLRTYSEASQKTLGSMLECHDAMVQLHKRAATLEHGSDPERGRVRAQTLYEETLAIERTVRELMDQPMETGLMEAERLRGRVMAMGSEILMHIDELYPELRQFIDAAALPGTEGTAGVGDAEMVPQRLLELSLTQSQIAKCARSMLVQGRSGTGKSVTIVHRMLQRQRAARTEGRSALRQLFVTRSSLLREDVRQSLARQAGGGAECAATLAAVPVSPSLALV